MILDNYTTSKGSEVPYYRFPFLARQDRIFHGVFTRHGGVSRRPYDSFNMAFNVGDHPKDVENNLDILREVVGAEKLIFMNQLHGRDILVLQREKGPEIRSGVHADAMITDIPYLGLMVKQADCQAVILFDPVKKVISNVHCGWRGNVLNILGAVVQRMRTVFNCRGSDLIACISPSLGPCCAEFVTYEDIFDQDLRRHMIRPTYFDLWEMSRVQLAEAGLEEDNIRVAGICSKCNTDLFFSYRAEGTTGRSATVVMLKPEHSK